MGRLLLVLSLISLIILSLGTGYASNNEMFWLASSSLGYQNVREVLMLILALQIATRPPRHLWLRALAGSLAIIVSAWALQETYAYHMQILDTMAFLAAGIATGVTALEPTSIPWEKHTTPKRRKPVAKTA
jgi:hypothetical protein